MDQAAVLWILLSAGALVAGIAVVGILVAPRSMEPVAGVAGAIGTLSAIYGFVRLPEAYGERIDILLYASAFVLAAFGGGYSLASSLLDQLVRDRKPTTLPDFLPPAIDRPAVILVACIEPERYEPTVTAEVFESLAAEDLLEPSLGSMPFLFLAQKARYRAVGGKSPSFEELRAVSDGLQEALTGSVVEVATCSGTHALDEIVTRAVGRGHRMIVVAELTVAESLHLSAAKRAVDASRITDLGVTVRYTLPLWDSPNLSSMLTERILGVAGPLDAAGVVLVGHGQPEERAHRNPVMDEQEAALLNRVRQNLTESGVDEQHVRLAWSEWRDPDVTSAVRHLAALGCRRIVISPACFPLDTIATRLELELGVRQARVDADVSVVSLPAWTGDDAVIAELKARIDEAMREPSE